MLIWLWAITMEQSQIFMIDLDFTVDDIKDKASYIARAKAEAQLCYNTPSTRRGRTWPRTRTTSGAQINPETS